MEFQWDSNHLDMGHAKPGPPPLIGKDEVKKALKTMSDKKAGGISEVVTEMLKASGEIGLRLLSNLFNQIIKENKIPSDWEKSIIINLYKGKGDGVDRGNFRGLKLLEHAMKLFEKVIEQHIRRLIDIDEMQFGFMPGKGTIDAIFIARQIQERYRAKKKDLYFTFVDLEKAFDRVPRKVVDWALRKVGLDEWIIQLIMAMYKNARSSVRINNKVGKDIPVNVGVHQGSVLSPLIFIVVLEALSREFRTGLPWEMLYADDLVLIAESLEEMEQLYQKWKDSMERKGLRVNASKTKVLHFNHGAGPLNKSGRYPCAVCWKGVGSNSISCTLCKSWVHARCSEIKGSLSKVKDFKCKRCLGQLPSPICASDKISLADNKLEKVDKFCYLGDMLDKNGSAESSVICRLQCGWKKFREILPLLTSKSIPIKIRGQLYDTCVRSVMLYGSETWPVKCEDNQRLNRNEMAMLRWMCGTKLKDRKSNVELRSLLGLCPILEETQKRRLRWFGHVERRQADNWLQKVQNLPVTGTRMKGRPQKRWMDVIMKDLKDKEIDRRLAQDRVGWRTACQRSKVKPMQAWNNK